MLRKHIYLTEPQIEGLKKLSQKSGLIFADLVRRAVDGYLLKNNIVLGEQKNVNQNRKKKKQKRG